MSHNMKYLSLFSGIGGFEKGIQQAYESNRILRTRSSRPEHGGGGESLLSLGEISSSKDAPPTCIGYSEIDKYAVQIYQGHFPNHTNYGDITKIDADELPDFDFLCGGFPCQSFSIAGKRGGFSDTRGTLFFDIARILSSKKPARFLLENVKGLLSHDNGTTFKIIIATLDELGYDLQWQVLNSKDFGVPQNRERVFIIGHIRGTPRPEVFPFRESNGTHLEEITQGVSDAQRIYRTSGLGKTLKGLGGGLGAKTGLYAIPVLTPDRLEKRQNGRRFKENGEPSFTLTSQDKHGIFDGAKIRRLTPIECERLQGFPDNWTNGISDTQRYKVLGNAVSVPVIKSIIELL